MIVANERIIVPFYDDRDNKTYPLKLNGEMKAYQKWILKISV